MSLLACALAVADNYPAQTLRVMFSVLFYVPVAVVLAMALSLSSDKRTTVLLVLLSSVAGWMFSPRIHIYWSDGADILDRYMTSFQNEGAWMLGGSLVGFVLSCLWSSRLEHARHMR